MNTKPDKSDAGATRQRDKGFFDEPSIGDVSEKRNVENLQTERKIGDCHIFDYQEFKNIKPRLGSEKDADRLEYDFKGLDFNVYRHLNLPKPETINVLVKASQKDHSQSKYFICCFLTHGEKGILCMPEGSIYVDDILRCFSHTHPTLYGKPKIFIFQACRGTNCEEGILESTDAGSIDNSAEFLDFLIVNSTYEGTMSFKTLSLKDETKNHGSYFIDELCRSLENFSHEKDLLQILTIVNYRIATFYVSATDDVKTNQKKQMPCVTSRLRTEVKFNKKIDLYETVDTCFFDNRRKQHRLGALSTLDPSSDYKSYEIPSSENVNFLSILNTDGDMGNDLNCFASKLWSVISEKNYQRIEKKNKKKLDLQSYLLTFAGQEIANTKCFICFIAGCAKGDSFYDSQNKKFLKQDLVERFVGKKCPSLVGKPKIFIFLLFPQTKPKKFSLIPCISADSGDLPKSTRRNFIPVHADILEVTIIVKDSKQLEVTVEKLISILKGGESGEDLLQSLTKMNNELVPSTEYCTPKVKAGKYSSRRSSLQEENTISFSFHSTLTKTVKLP
ncbi:caspase-3 [Trichonephila clavata]|uniref:Caspase-3 n=1 Tax=Trichonephila clavata TaxID=2740835 RepID=A0A8X6IFE9_TRICU|nr:caspase-3 [Trichonephila clavata]